ncbi:MAG: hypothetical protein IPK74_04235 [Deltaproteobacteria bacterium]|nr:hypothetical protein [Deltaproteobacteria bacterium]
MTVLHHAQPSPHILAALAQAGARTDRSARDQAEALVELAVDLQTQPKQPQDLYDAIHLYERAEQLSEGDVVAVARAKAGRGVALRRLPGYTADSLVAARACLDEALVVLRRDGGDEEVAELEMNLGLVIHALAGAGAANLAEAIPCYQAALRFFTAATHPREYATLHNNLATLYLGMRLGPEKEGLREALAVQSFQEALAVVTLDDDPVEYAMLQNNLGNALQAIDSTHRFDNLQRAIEAYDEALRVRTRHDMPLEHANTLVNKANALMNLPDGEDAVDNPRNLAAAIELLTTAEGLYREHGVFDRAEIAAQCRDGLARELAGEPG